MRRTLFLTVAFLGLGGSLAAWALDGDSTGAGAGNGVLPRVFWSNLPALQERMRSRLTTPSGKLDPAFATILEATDKAGLVQRAQDARLVQYAIDCAVKGSIQGVPDIAKGPFTPTQVLNTTGAWLTAPLDQSQREDLYACLAARLNPTGKEVFIRLKGAHVTNRPVVNPKAVTFPLEEAYWAAVEEPAEAEEQTGDTDRPATECQTDHDQPREKHDHGHPPMAGGRSVGPPDHCNRPMKGGRREGPPVARPDQSGPPIGYSPKPSETHETEQAKPSRDNAAHTRSGQPKSEQSIPYHGSKSKVTIHVWASDTVRTSCEGYAESDQSGEAISNRICGKTPGNCNLVTHSLEERNACQGSPKTGWSCPLPGRPIAPVIQTRMKCEDWCSLYPDCTIPQHCPNALQPCPNR